MKFHLFIKNILLFIIITFGVIFGSENIKSSLYSVDEQGRPIPPNQIELEEDYAQESFLQLLNNPQTYEINGVLAMANEEVDVYLRQLSNKKKTFFLQQKLINLHKLTINERYSLIFACIFLFLIGASLGAIIRKGGLGLPLVLSIVIFLTYHYIGVFGKNAAEDSSISPFIGSWISTFTIAPFAIYLTMLVSTDRVIRFSLFDKAIELFNKIKTKND